MTLPDIKSSEQWKTFEGHEQLAEGTYAPMTGPEKGVVHSFYSREEVEQLFEGLEEREIVLDERGRWIVQGLK